MLHIFKGHPLGTSLLDDFGFYEQREKSLQATRRRRPAVMDVDFEFYDDSCGKIFIPHIPCGSHFLIAWKKVSPDLK